VNLTERPRKSGRPASEQDGLVRQGSVLHLTEYTVSAVRKNPLHPHDNSVKFKLDADGDGIITHEEIAKAVLGRSLDESTRHAGANIQAMPRQNGPEVPRTAHRG
jgi:hypothetical protein